MSEPVAIPAPEPLTAQVESLLARLATLSPEFADEMRAALANQPGAMPLLPEGQGDQIERDSDAKESK